MSTTYRIITKGNRIMPHAQTLDMKPEEILTNDVTFPWEHHHHTTRLWIIGNEFGAIAAVWASCEQYALDEACDAGLTAGLSTSTTEEELDAMTEEERDEWEETITRLGNAGEPHDLTYLWMQEADLHETPVQTIAALAEARGAMASDLSEL
jgi:hypothetical protein